MTPSLTPIVTVIAALAAACLAAALAATLREAVSWADVERFVTALASTVEVVLDRLLDGDPGGAARAFAALLRG